MPKTISPHVSIYTFPIAAISSITNRVTGLFLTTGLLVVPPYFFYKEYGPSSRSAAPPPIPPYVKHALLFIGSFSITYHSLGGIRHIAYDKYPSLINNTFSKNSSVYMFFLASLSAVSFVKGMYDSRDN
ncbi:MAG: succinate dehydrogenase, cytochrome b556 subunit [Rhodobacteraceae bacterium]|nr:MAG: succinate dehydrogenase, cytochrome b556 subunit [Paracoccaceae bacterium]